MSPYVKSQSLRSEKENLIELESIDFFVRMMGIGMPRSVGEIYGLLCTEAPLSMDQIANKLEMSLGSASQGLQTLRSLKAVRTSYVAGERKIIIKQKLSFVDYFQIFLKKKFFLTWRVLLRGLRGWKLFYHPISAKMNFIRFVLKS